MSLFIALLITICVLFYKYIKYLYSYWQRHGVPQLSPKFPFGNFTQNFLQKISIGDNLCKMYNSSSEPFIGIYSVLKPTLLIRNPKLINKICVEDFQNFMGRGIHSGGKYDPLTSNLFTLEGEKWKVLRTNLSQTFTPRKIKNMLPIIDKISDKLKAFLIRLIDEMAEDNNLISNGLIDIREIVGRYTTDVITSIGFGIEINSIDDPDDEFRKCARKVFEINYRNGIRFFIFFIWPIIFRIFRIKMFDRSIETFLKNMVKNNLEYRKINNIVRQDFFQYMIELRNSVVNTEFTTNMTIEEMTAESFIFLTAGLETSSSTITYFLYEMARNPNIQEKIHEEINQVLIKKYSNHLTIDAVNEMIYMDWCIDETLRLYPVLSFLNRVSTQSCHIEDDNVYIEKGVTIMISILGLHRDPKYFPNPKKFIPERFNPKNFANKTFAEMPYLPFGIGPKNCIGLRLGKLLVKIGLIKILQSFVCQLETEQNNRGITIIQDDYLEFTPHNFMLAPKHKILLKITKR